MNLDQLRYFSKLAETEHYGHASRELFISQPALSNSIKGLEAELNQTKKELVEAVNAVRKGKR